MMTEIRLGPEFTPDPLKKLLLLTAGISIGSILLDIFLYYLFGFFGIQFYLSLSWDTFHSLFLWQPFTYFFAPPSAFSEISINFLLSLAFQLYALWIMGAAIIENMDSRPFIRFYCLSAIISAFLTLLMMELTGHYTVFGGPAPPLLATLSLWSLLNPNAPLLLFFLIPVKIKWVASGILGAIFLVTLSQFDLTSMTFYLSGPCLGYLYFHYFYKKPKTFGKIIDFSTGKEEVQDDATFIDAMLEKISKKGENSLSPRERTRMKQISEKMKHK